jgi:hypothetical protein
MLLMIWWGGWVSVWLFILLLHPHPHHTPWYKSISYAANTLIDKYLLERSIQQQAKEETMI